MTHCYSDAYGSYDTADKAKVACELDVRCSGVYDDACDNSGAYLCAYGYTEETSSSSCIYMKTGRHTL